MTHTVVSSASREVVIGPDGDLKAAYRKWYAQQMEEHDRTILHMMREFERRGGGHAR